MHSMVLRVAAAQAAVDRFSGCVLKWSTNDCGRLAAFNLRKLGYRPPMPKAGSYSSPAGALKHIRRLGFGSLEEILDAIPLPRIAPAAALPADLVAMPAADGWVALAVALGNGRLLAFLDMDGVPTCGVVAPTYASGFEPVTAWRADPCPR